MTSSTETAGGAALDDLPPALSSMWRLVRLGYRNEPRLLTTAFVLALLAAVPDALVALWLALLGAGVVHGDARLAMVAAIGMGLSGTLTWLLRVVSTRVQRRFRDKVTIALERHVARLQATVATVTHQERAECLDRLSVLRDQVFVLDHLYMSLFSTCGWILRLGATVVLLGSIHPALVLLLLFALSTVLTSGWRPGVERRARERGAQAERLSRHLFVSRRPRRRPRSCASSGSRSRSSAGGVPPGRAGTPSCPAPAGRVRSGTRWPGRCSASATSPRSSSSRPGSTRPRRRSCWCWLPVRGSRATSARPSADRLPARHLDGRLATPRLARGLRGGPGHRRPARPRADHRRDPPGGRQLHLSRLLHRGPR